MNFGYQKLQVFPDIGPQSSTTTYSLVSMPLDILELIFQYSLNPSVASRPPDYRSRSSPGHIGSFPDYNLTPMTLCHINSHLRSIAFRLSSLWSSIYICNIALSQIPLLDLWLVNAGTRPLSIVLSLSRQRGFPDIPILQKVTELLSARSHQWRTMFLHFGAFASRHIFPDLRREDVVRLEALGICLEDWGTFDRYRLYNVLVSSPALRELEWFSTFGESLPNYVPWQQLTHINLYSPRTMGETISILEKTENLKSMNLGWININPTTFKGQTLPLDLISVKAKMLGITHSQTFVTILPRLRYPQLTDLEVDVVDLGPSSSGWDTLSAILIDPTDSPLLRFTYSSALGVRSPIPVEFYLNQILSLPRLSQLVQLVLHCELSNFLIEFLTHLKPGLFGVRKTSLNLPHLETISLSRCRLTVDGLVSQMVLSRISGKEVSRGCLRHVDVTVMGPCDFKKDKLAFQDLKNSRISANLVVL